MKVVSRTLENSRGGKPRVRESKAVGVLGFDSGLQRGPRDEERGALPSPGVSVL